MPQKHDPGEHLTEEQERRFGYVLVGQGTIKWLKDKTYEQAKAIAREELENDLSIGPVMIYKPCLIVATESTINHYLSKD